MSDHEKGVRIQLSVCPRLVLPLSTSSAIFFSFCSSFYVLPLFCVFSLSFSLLSSVSLLSSLSDFFILSCIFSLLSSLYSFSALLSEALLFSYLSVCVCVCACEWDSNTVDTFTQLITNCTLFIDNFRSRTRTYSLLF